MFAQRRRRWANIETSLGEFPVFLWQTVDQRLNNIGAMSRVCWEYKRDLNHSKRSFGIVINDSKTFLMINLLFDATRLKL